ncbi:hypothetical protein ABBQ32_007424 [Trebouxia sp. C0010 RCD-2024]
MKAKNQLLSASRHVKHPHLQPHCKSCCAVQSTFSSHRCGDVLDVQRSLFHSSSTASNIHDRYVYTLSRTTMNKTNAYPSGRLTPLAHQSIVSQAAVHQELPHVEAVAV